jgi:hypothetical protein
MPPMPLETWPRGVWLALSGRGIDVDRVARSSAEALGTAYHRPRVAVSLLLRRMVDVFVGQVRASCRSPRSVRASGDFYFDFARVLAGEPLDRVVQRIGALADAEHPDGHSFVDELRERGIRIAIDLPAFSTAFTARDPHLVQMRRGPTFAVWFDGLQIRIRDTLLFTGVGRSAAMPPSAQVMTDLLESERSLRAFLAVVNDALGLRPERR